MNMKRKCGQILVPNILTNKKNQTQTTVLKWSSREHNLQSMTTESVLLKWVFKNMYH